MGERHCQISNGYKSIHPGLHLLIFYCTSVEMYFSIAFGHIVRGIAIKLKRTLDRVEQNERSFKMIKWLGNNLKPL